MSIDANDAKQLVALVDGGIDHLGENTVFRLKAEDGSVASYRAGHVGLGQLCNGLAQLAAEMLRRRVRANKTASHLGLLAVATDPVAQIDFRMAPDGSSALWICTRESGAVNELQIGLAAMEAVRSMLPKLCGEMRQAQNAAKRKQ